MLRRNQPALCVRVGEVYEYVFCRGMPSNTVVTTKTRWKALHGDNLSWFENHFGSRQFQIEKRLP